MDISDTDGDITLPVPSKSKPDGSAQAIWISIGNVTKYKAFPTKICFMKKIDEGICPTCKKPINDSDQANANTATAGFRLEGADEPITAKMFTTTVKSAYSQLYPNCAVPSNTTTLDDDLFEQLPKAVSCVINPANIVTKITLV